MSPTDAAEKEFDAWWTHTGERIAADVVTSAIPGLAVTVGMIEKHEAIRLLCRVAYFQGRIDEDYKLEAQLQRRLHASRG